MYRWWSLCIRMPGETYRRRLRSLLLYLCYVFWALINSLFFSFFIDSELTTSLRVKSKGGFLRRRHEGTTDCGDMYQWARFSNNVSQWVKLPSVGFALSCRNGTFTADCVCFRQTLCNSGSLWGYLALWGPVCDASGQEQTRTPHALNAQQQQTNLRLDCAQMEAVTVATVTVSPFSPCHVGDNQYFLTVPRWRQSVLTMWRCPQSCRDKRSTQGRKHRHR